MSGMEAANLETLAKLYDAQNQWLMMRWKALMSLPLPFADQAVLSDENNKQLSLPGFPPREKSSRL